MFENFEKSGPRYLSAVDWKCPHDRKSVAACLVNGTSVLERARQDRKDPDCRWWTWFRFQKVEEIIDREDSSICGTIYQFNRSLFSFFTSARKAPDYVVTFRGTMLTLETIKQDLDKDIKLIVNGLEKTSRAMVALQAVVKLVSTYGKGKTVWLAGHSLGAAIAMHVGQNMVKSYGLHLETFLFNPPYAGVPIDKIIKVRSLKRTLKVGISFAKAIIAAFVEEDPDTGHKHFDMLKSWVPHMFVNKKDIICSEYIGYFGHRDHMERAGMGAVGRLACQKSTASLLRSFFGKDVVPLHLLPSASLFINTMDYENDIIFRSHRINQWWRKGLNLKSNKYLLNLNRTTMHS